MTDPDFGDIGGDLFRDGRVERLRASVLTPAPACGHGGPVPSIMNQVELIEKGSSDGKCLKRRSSEPEAPLRKVFLPKKVESISEVVQRREVLRASLKQLMYDFDGRTSVSKSLRKVMSVAKTSK